MAFSRAEDILKATIDGTEYDTPPQSRLEKLLIDLKEVIEEGGGGGGGGTTNYNLLTNKPSVNGHELTGNKTATQLGLQDKLSWDETPTHDSSNPVRSGGVFNELAKKVTAEEGKGLSSNDYTTDEKTKLAGLSNYDDTALAGRVTANETAISGKVDKETGKGLSANDYTDTDKGVVDGVTTALAGKADVDDVIDSAVYDSANHLILFKNGTTTLFSLDAAAFVKDGMVDDVEISGGNLVITFNTDAGKQAISIPLTDIFDPAIYYTKTATDGLLADKADKVTSATNNNLVAMDANGNLKDSGKSASDFATPTDITYAVGNSRRIQVRNEASGDKYYLIAELTLASNSFVFPYSLKGSIGRYATTDKIDFDIIADFRVGSAIKGYVSSPVDGADYDIICTEDGNTKRIYLYVTKTYSYVDVTISGQSGIVTGSIAYTSTMLGTAGAKLSNLTPISNKADKVTSATSGNLASLDANGNLTDSGVAATKITDAHDEDSGTSESHIDLNTYRTAGTYFWKPLKPSYTDNAPSGITESNVLLTVCPRGTSTGNVVELVQTLYHRNSQAIYVRFCYSTTNWTAWRRLTYSTIPATAGNLATLDANGNLTDSGVAASGLYKTIKISDSTLGNKVNYIPLNSAYGESLSTVVYLLGSRNNESDLLILGSRSGQGKGVPYLLHLGTGESGVTEVYYNTTTGSIVLMMNTTSYASALTITQISGTKCDFSIGTISTTTSLTDYVPRTIISTASTGSAAILSAGTDTTQRSWTAKMLRDELQDKTLATSLTIGGVSQTTVEDALGALNTAKAEISSGVPTVVTEGTVTVREEAQWYKSGRIAVAEIHFTTNTGNVRSSLRGYPIPAASFPTFIHIDSNNQEHEICINQSGYVIADPDLDRDEYVKGQVTYLAQ